MDMLINRLLHCFLDKLRETTEKSSVKENLLFYSSSHFHHMLRIERKRAERSGKPFLLMLIDLSNIDDGEYYSHIPEEIKKILVSCSRAIDIRGWYEHNAITGTIFTEMASVDEKSIQVISHKVHKKISDSFHAEWVGKIRISFHPIVPCSVLRLLPKHIPAKKYEIQGMEKSRLFQASANE
jgi:hypothetical protein